MHEASTPTADTTSVQRLNYIGSKYKLLGWLFDTIKSATGIGSFEGVQIVDVFAGTGIVSYALRQEGSDVISNDVELYSFIITHALSRSAFTDRCREMIAQLNAELDAGAHLGGPPGYITHSYSPHGPGDRTYFTVDNARRMDYLRQRLEGEKAGLSDDDHAFVLASLLVSADRVANVAAVYGCYLKQFKATALRPLVLAPVHHDATPGSRKSRVLNCDATGPEFLAPARGDIAYVDPPYNGRQYSKNYFPLAMLARAPSTLAAEPPLKGKTGIPESCFVSDMCKKRRAMGAMRELVEGLQCEWVFVSYNTEGIIPEPEMVEMMETLGTVSVTRRDYRRFKSYKYNEDKPVQELLFCLRKSACGGGD